MQIRGLSEGAAGGAHQAACALRHAQANGADSPLTLTLQASEEDEALLAGAVPQPTDWLRAWQAVRSSQSWREAASNAGVENFAHQIHDKRSPQPRGLKHMAEIMQEVIRGQKRQWIRQSSSIALSFDDRQSYKLILFRCECSVFVSLRRCSCRDAEGASVARRRRWMHTLSRRDHFVGSR